MTEDLTRCPSCLGALVHLVGTHTYASGNDGRLAVRLDFLCEAGHDFDVRFENRRGQTVVEVEA